MVISRSPDFFNAWQMALAQFTEDQIARGVKSCQDWTDSFPPTLAQFKKMCLTVRPEELPNYTEKRMAVEKAAGKPIEMIEHLARSANSETAKRELRRMFRILKGEDVESKDDSYHRCGLGHRWPGAA